VGGCWGKVSVGYGEELRGGGDRDNGIDVFLVAHTWGESGCWSSIL